MLKWDLLDTVVFVLFMLLVLWGTGTTVRIDCLLGSSDACTAVGKWHSPVKV